jgi:tRNA threonylcarbamoyladenosine biosynthesis protein TsaB
MEGTNRIIAIETSGRQGSIAALYGEKDGCHLNGCYIECGDQRTAQALAPALKRLLDEANWEPASVDLVAVAVGPGSFTGLRIGVTTGKAFAYAANADVIGVNTLEAIALQATCGATPLWVISDAQRQELFTAKFVFDDGGAFRLQRETAILGQDAWLSALQAGDYVTGPALGRLQSRLPAGVVVAPQALWQPMAESVGRLAWNAYRAGRRDDVWKLAPQYYRASAAEEKNPV